MAKIIVNNPKQVINGGAKKYYFKVKGLGGLKGDKGDKGDTGAQGLQGIQGLSATVRIGTTTTGEPGTQASVRNSGTESNAVLDFTIPRGDVGSQPELVQTTGISTTKAMSQNATTEALNNISETKQDKLTAGDNVQIENGVISAKDTTYTAGNGLNLNGTEFSADTTVLATKEDLEGYYTKPETDNLLAPKLESEVLTELPTTGEKGKLYLTPKSHTTQTATGNPITATVTEGAGALEGFQLDGDTFQQTYTGKNLLPINISLKPQGITANYDQNTGLITIGGTPKIQYPQLSNLYSLPSVIKSGSNIVFSTTSVPTGVSRIIIRFYEETGSAYINCSLTTDNPSIAITAEADWHRVKLILEGTPGTAISGTFGLQIETGAQSATDFEPYVGGQPSPNPDYPQPIQTVTGLQTITVNSTDYHIDLGSIELCKLGEYHDYIWKDGEDWKVHKATDSITLDQMDWTNETAGSGYGSRYRSTTLVGQIYLIGSNNDIADMVCSNYTVGNIVSTWTGGGQTIALHTNKSVYIYDSRFKDDQTTTALDSWLSSVKPSLYYPLATPTDTVITNQTLIAQIEAIRTASLQNGANTITNTAIGSNLAGDMEVGYYGYNPRNRYDKWLWLDINNEYEQIGG